MAETKMCRTHQGIFRSRNTAGLIPPLLKIPLKTKREGNGGNHRQAKCGQGKHHKVSDLHKEPQSPEESWPRETNPGIVVKEVQTGTAILKSV